MRIILEFIPEQSEVARRRLRYAFALFCAIYDHDIADNSAGAKADLCISYRAQVCCADGTPLVRLSCCYNSRSSHEAAPAPQLREVHGKEVVLVHAPVPGQEPDWLAEIFEWVSCADEYSIASRDEFGRIRFSDSYMGRHGLNPQIPYAAVAMQSLQQAICRVIPQCDSSPPSPVSHPAHFIINTHDIDYLPTSLFSSLRRQLKNSLISLLLYRSPLRAASQVALAVRLAFGGRNPLDQVQRILDGLLQRNARSTFFWITARRHRRDANYDIEQPLVTTVLRQLTISGMEIGIHGSYFSLDQAASLAAERKHLEEQGYPIYGNRQHWLRFTLGALIDACERAGVQYDCSVGWSERIGFRAGACFAYPPYRFDEERPARFLEFPLALMDGSLLKDPRVAASGELAVTKMLAASRALSWGGFSALWHNTAFDGAILPKSVGKLFWKLLDKQAEWGDSWVTGRDFLSSVSSRYVKAGLLPETFVAPELNPEFAIAVGDLLPAQGQTQ